MAKFKPIARLGHQFGGYLTEPKLDAREIAEALFDAELIEYGITRSTEDGPSHYAEVRFNRVSASEYRERIVEALLRYCRKHGLEAEVSEAARPVTANGNKPTDHYDPNDFGV